MGKKDKLSLDEMLELGGRMELKEIHISIFREETYSGKYKGIEFLFKWFPLGESHISCEMEARYDGFDIGRFIKVYPKDAVDPRIKEAYQQINLKFTQGKKPEKEIFNTREAVAYARKMLKGIYGQEKK